MLGLQAPMFFRLTSRASSAAGTRAPQLRLRHAHHLGSDAVCFLLILVPRRVDCQFGLYRSSCARTNGNPAKIVPQLRWCHTGEYGGAFFSVALEQPQKYLIPYLALKVEDRVRIMTSRNVGSTDQRSLGGRSRLPRIGFLYESAHGQSPIVCFAA
jgi:hypothetical protein